MQVTIFIQSMRYGTKHLLNIFSFIFIFTTQESTAKAGVDAMLIRVYRKVNQ